MSLEPMELVPKSQFWYELFGQVGSIGKWTKILKLVTINQTKIKLVPACHIPPEPMAPVPESQYWLRRFS